MFNKAGAGGAGTDAGVTRASFFVAFAGVHAEEYSRGHQKKVSCASTEYESSIYVAFLERAERPYLAMSYLVPQSRPRCPPAARPPRRAGDVTYLRPPLLAICYHQPYSPSIKIYYSFKQLLQSYKNNNNLKYEK
ncbi:hypothetical protein EVAR_88462_1 [Eumeta japonica]|uniref:Uncharacterized protein n=1 Tax=Eumeta variegata TaxID=151549 RepID=A0A4C1XTM8_EUMVA|nr:hypothetical protein EVAR_88462_1 [Eumeta japonica]